MKTSTSTSVARSESEVSASFHPSKTDPRRLLIERIVGSSQFRGSLRLREVLLYIAECALKDAPESATEQQIGVHVFHRAPGYNSSEDSIVRTHARLLRQKLAEFFATEGAAEPVIVEVPKGHYLPLFRSRTEAPPPVVALAQIATREPTGDVPSAAGRWRWVPRGFVLGIFVALVLAASGFVFARNWTRPTAQKSAVDKFWAPFLNGDPPVVIYSNTRFVGDSKTGLRYAPATIDAAAPVVDHYTGIGELASVYELTRLFDAHHSTFILKRSLLVTWDEAKSRNLVFIGSPAENPSLNALPSLADFTLVANAESSGFSNNHPRPGEPALYSRPERPLTTDFAVIELMPGVLSGNRTLVFSGLTTLGTQAAVEYAARKETVGELLKLVTSPSGEIRPFEALLSVPLEGGVPLQAKLVSLRVH